MASFFEEHDTGDSAYCTLQIVRLHLRNQEGQEDLKRPFRAGPGWMSSGSGPSTDKVSIEAAEKANLLYRAPET